jgi:gluconate kinase
MVFIITGAAESERNTVGRLLAEAWGWEFTDAQHLHPRGRPDARRFATSLASSDPSSGSSSDPTSRLETLSAAIKLWIYEWRDVVVSCPMLTERDRKQLSKVSSLVKIVCLEASHATGRTSVLDRPVRLVRSENARSENARSEFSAGWRPARKAAQDTLTVDSSRQVEDIIAEITSVLMM